MNKSIAVTLSCLLLASLLVCGIFSFKSSDRARILRVSGDVIIEREGETITPMPDMVLNSRDRIQTGANSFVEVAYDDALANVFRVESSSRAVLESCVIKRGAEVFIDKGDIMVKLNKMGKGSSFKIRTPTAVCGARGTGFRVALSADKTVITEYESSIYVKGVTRTYEEMEGELSLEEGWKTSIRRFEEPAKVERVPESEFAVWDAWTRQLWDLSQGSVPHVDSRARMPASADKAIGSGTHYVVKGCLGSFAAPDVSVALH